MKRFLAVFLILCTLTMLIACNFNNTQEKTQPEVEKETEKEEEKETEKEEEKETEKEEEKETEKEENKPSVNNIFLSKSAVTLGIGETANLIATVSPSNIQVILTWSSSDNSIAEIDNQGKITAKSAGDAVIKVEAPNGVLAVCNVEVKIKTGSVTGTVTYKYNNFVGNKPDTNSAVLLISTNVTSLPSSVALGMIYSLPDGCYGTKVDGTGNYRFDNVPVGKYYLVIISENTNSGSEYGQLYWGFSVYNMFSEKDKSTANTTCWLHKIQSKSIVVNDGETTNYSYDFGITYC